MGISILGIIAVQLVWMNNAIRVKTEMFNRGVNEALHQTVNRLEDIHNLGVVNEMVFNGDSLSWTHEFENDFDFDEDFKWETESDSIRVFINNSSKRKRPVRIIREYAPGNDEAIIEIEVEDDSEAPEITQSIS